MFPSRCGVLSRRTERQNTHTRLPWSFQRVLTAGGEHVWRSAEHAPPFRWTRPQVVDYWVLYG